MPKPEFPQTATIGEIARACLAQSEPGLEVYATVTVYNGQAVVDFHEVTAETFVPNWLRRQAL